MTGFSSAGRSTIAEPRWYLGIGAQKAGTTWLSHNLRQHPGIWSLPLKAFHFFNEPARPVFLRALDRGPGNRRWQRLASHELPRALLDPRRWRDAPWLLRFVFWPRTDASYRALMTPPPGKVGGEVTPAYARLDDAAVERVHRVLPQARIVYLLRNPVHRTWSQVAMHWRKNGQPDLSRVPGETLMKYLGDENVLRNSDYLRTLATWERYYPSDQIHVDFLERVAEHPDRVMKDLLRFVGLDGEAGPIPSSVAEARNVGRQIPMPPDIARFLARRYLEPCRLYHRRFDNAYTAAWLEGCERMAGS